MNSSRRIHRLFAKGLCIFFLSIILTACSPPPEEKADELFKKGEFFCLETEWDKARDVLRQALLLEPDHSGAHFYLARAYLLAEDFRPAIAEGEFLTALHYFERDGKRCRIERFDSDYFEFITYIDLTKVCMYEYMALRGYGAHPKNLTPIIERSRIYLAKAKEIGTVPEDIDFMEENLRRLESDAGI
jgi:tetratricopeptide (TPR) repeat protein